MTIINTVSRESGALQDYDVADDAVNLAAHLVSWAAMRQRVGPRLSNTLFEELALDLRSVDHHPVRRFDHAQESPLSWR